MEDGTPDKEVEKAACVHELESAFSIMFCSMQCGGDRGTKGEKRDNPSNRQAAQSEQEEHIKRKWEVPQTSLNTLLRADLRMLNLSQQGHEWKHKETPFISHFFYKHQQ